MQQDGTLERLFYIGSVLVVAVGFVLIHYMHINLDFWNDELYTMVKFALTDYRTIVTDYHVPNNHILFNLLYHFYLKMSGVSDLGTILEMPWRFRILPLFYSAITALFVFRISRYFTNSYGGLIAVVLLLTTLPYFTFSLQIRGYGLSMMLLSMFTFFVLEFFRGQRASQLAGIVISGALALYTIPSNLYFVLAVLAPVPFFGMRLKASNANLRVLLASLLGLLTGLAMYAPVFRDVFANDYVKPGPSFDTELISFYWANIPSSFISGRWILMLISLAGLVIGFRKWKNMPLWICLSVLLLPMLLVLARGDRAPLRVFVVAAPFLSVLIAAGLFFLWKRTKAAHVILFAGVVVYCSFVLAGQMEKAEQQVLTDIRDGRKSQDLFAQYYSWHYHPLADTRILRSIHKEAPLPVVVYRCEEHGIPYYLDIYNIPFRQTYKLEDLKSAGDAFYVMSNFPGRALSLPGYESTLISSSPSFHSIIFLRRN